MAKKTTVGIIFGGRSAEHEVSLQSAKSIIDAIDKEKYELVLIGVDKQGRWYLNDEADYLLHADDPSQISLKESDDQLATLSGENQKQLHNIHTHQNLPHLDVVFPVLHGPFGEDGTVQGLLKLAGIPFVGPGVLGSAISMDKDIMKRLMNDAGIPNAKFLLFSAFDQEQISFQEVKDKLGMPVFIKPANMGSSVGVNKANNEAEFDRYLNQAFEFDHKVIVEEFIKGREIECAVLGNENPKASIPGEILAHHDFYSYDAKYIDDKGATLEVPAKMDQETIGRVQEISIKTFKALNCEGLSRVDMFVTADGSIYVNEINTLPGFTKISMYPKLWEYSGIPYTALIDRLLQLAMARYERDSKLKTKKEF